MCRLNHQSKLEDFSLNGLFLDQRRAECFSLDGIVEGFFCADARKTERGAGEGEAFGVEVFS